MKVTWICREVSGYIFPRSRILDSFIFVGRDFIRAKVKRSLYLASLIGEKKPPQPVPPSEWLLLGSLFGCFVGQSCWSLLEGRRTTRSFARWEG